MLDYTRQNIEYDKDGNIKRQSTTEAKDISKNFNIQPCPIFGSSNQNIFFSNLTEKQSEAEALAYYAVIKAWVQEHIAVFEKRFTVAYDDTKYKITFTPIAENISNRPLTFYVSGTTLYLEYPYSGTSTYSTYTDLKYDSPIHLYDSDDFFIGIGDSKFFYGIFGGKRFDDGTDISVLFAMYSGTIHIYHILGSSYDRTISSVYRRDAKLTDTYVIQRLIIENSSIIMNNVFYLDSGMSLPPANDFKIGDAKYCRLNYNIVTKL